MSSLNKQPADLLSTKQLNKADQKELDEIFEAARNGANPENIQQRFRNFFSARLQIETTKKGSSNIDKTTGRKKPRLRFGTVRRRLGPPFSEFLDMEQRQELMEIIKSARNNGSSQQEVRNIVDNYLEKNLTPEKLHKVKQLKQQATATSQKKPAPVNQLNAAQYQMLNTMLNEAQMNQVTELTSMLRNDESNLTSDSSIKKPSESHSIKLLASNLEKYLSSILTAQQMQSIRNAAVWLWSTHAYL